MRGTDGRNHELGIVSLICAEAKRQGKQYTKRMLPWFVIPGARPSDGWSTSTRWRMWCGQWERSDHSAPGARGARVIVAGVGEL